MKSFIIALCLIGSLLANPIFQSVLLSSEHDSNSTESLSMSQSSENSTSELQSSEEIDSKQSSESESSESTSEDKTSEESDSKSEEDNKINDMVETEDNSMGSEENVRKQTWMVLGVPQVSSLEDNTSTEVKIQPEDLSKELKTLIANTKTADKHANLPLLHNLGNSSEISGGNTDVGVVASNSSESESSESLESNESTDSSDESKSTEDSDQSDSREIDQTKDCMNGTQSCESEEYFPHTVGDDAHFSVDGLSMPNEVNREFRLR